MQVFLSWSGQRSRYLAETLRGWLPRVIQSLRPWMSDEDIAAGSRWLTDVSRQLGNAKVGILCVTPENQSNPWLVFEAGALSKTLEQPFVCPLLFDMSPGQLTGPLAQFQALELDKEGVLRILINLNNASEDAILPQKDLEETFEVWWPKLQEKLDATPGADTSKIEKRTADEILDEILSNTREQLRRENLRLEHTKAREFQFDNKFLPLMEAITAKAEQMKTPAAFLTDLAKMDFAARVNPASGSDPNAVDLVHVGALSRSMPEGPMFDEPTVRQMEELVQHMKSMMDASRSQTLELLTPPKPDGES